MEFDWTIAAMIASAAILVMIGVVAVSAWRQRRPAIDGRTTHILEALPGGNCGACGRPSCAATAAAIVAGRASEDACVAGGTQVTSAVSRALALTAEGAAQPVVATAPVEIGHNE